MLTTPTSLLAVATAFALAAGCGSTPPAQSCLVGADCASGVCGPDGTCQPAPDAGADPADAGDLDTDAGDNGTCRPNLDGFIDRSEVPLRAGLTAAFRVAEDVAVDTAGTSLPNGTRRWDLSMAMTGDQTRDIELAPMSGAWFADAFPAATYTAPLAAEDGLRGVFQVADDALLMLGIVSVEAGATRTEIVYDPPIAVLEFPLTNGASWSTSSSVTGLLSGVPSAYNERYEQTVDAVGTLDTPYGEFPVLRVRLELTQTFVGAIVTRRTFMFVTECFGTVANVVSQDYETSVEFTDAAEVRRLTP